MSEAFLIIQDVAIVIAAFTGSAATAFYSFKAIAKQHKLTVEEADKKILTNAYESLLISSRNFLIKNFQMHFLSITDSNFKEQIEWISSELRSLVEAISRVWLVGSPEAVILANRFGDLITDVMAIPTPKADLEKRIQLVTEKEKILMRIRREFVELARQELGKDFTPLVGNLEENQPANGPTTNPTTPKSDQASNEN